MTWIDLRVARRPGSIVTIDGADYTIGSECFRGGTALCYSASRDGQTEHYVIKEIYPLAGARRNKDGDVCSTSGNSYEMCLQSFQNEIILMESASSDTFQSWHYERFDIARGIGVMRMNAKDTKRLDKAITEYAGHNYTPMERLGWALRITRSLLTGLHKIHTTARLLHLDLSLTNIFLSQDGNGPNAFFLDFGEARQFNHLNVCLADSGSTSLFGAPERFSRAKRFLTPAADTFSSAVLFYHILTAGSWAYQNQSIPEAVMLSKWDCAEAKYGLGCLELPPGTEKAVFHFLKKGMAYRPDRRYQSAAEMLDEVERLIKIVSQKGVFRELILDRSAELYQKTVFYKIDPELEPQIPEPENQHVLYLGDGGGGKTTHLFTHWAKCLQKCKEDFTQPVPIYISVSSFKGVEYQNNFILDEILDLYINKWEGCQEEGRTELRELFRSGQYLLLLDGFNTSIQPDGLYNELSKHTTEFPMLRIYAASRIPFEGRALDCFQQIPVASLTAEQVQNVLSKAGKPALAPGQLLETLKRPMFLSLYLRTNPKLQEKVSTPGEILGCYWRKHLLDQFRAGDHLDRNTELWDYALNTAFPLLASRVDSLHFQSNQVDGAEYAVGDILHVLKNCGLVRLVCAFRTKPHQWSFTHQIYQEFGKAKWIDIEMDEWEGGDENSPDKQLTRGPLEPEVLSLLANIRREHLQIEGGKLSIQHWMQKHLAGKRGIGPQMAVRNLIEALKTARGVNMAGCYQGLDLTLTDFYDTSVVGANFKNAVISDTTFFSAGHRYNISHLVSCSVAKRKWLISASSDERKIIIWDRDEQRPIQNIDCAGEIICIAVSESKKIAWFCDLDESSEITVWNIETDERLTITCTAKWFNQIGACSLCFHPTCDKLIFTNAGFGQIEWDFSKKPAEEHIYRIPNNAGVILSTTPHQGAISSYLRYLAAHWGNTIVLRDVSGKEKYINLDTDLQAYSISPNGRYFGCIVAPYDFETIEMYSGELLLFDLQEFHPSPQNLGKVNNRARIALTNNHIIVGCRKTTKRNIEGGIWDIKTGQRISVPMHVSLDAAVGIDSEEIAVGVGTEVQVINVQTGNKYELGGHRMAEYSTLIRFIHNENAFCRFCLDGTVAKFSLDDKSCHKILEGTTFKNSLATYTIPDAKCSHIFVTVGKEELHIYDAKTGILDHNINGDFSACDTFTLLQNNRLLLAESSAHHSIILYDLDEQTTTQISGVNQWMEPIALHASLDTNHDTLSVSGKAVHINQLHAYDYPDRLRSKRIQLIWRSLSNQDQLLNQQLFTSVGLPQSVDYVRDVHVILENTSSMVSAHYDGTLRLWAIGRDAITYQMSLSLCRDPIEQLEVISDDTILAMSRQECVFVCRIRDDKMEVVTTWSAAPKSLPGVSGNEFKRFIGRSIGKLIPVSTSLSYLTYSRMRDQPVGYLVNHFTGEIITTAISEQYDPYQCRWLIRSQQRNTVVVRRQRCEVNERFSVYNAEDGSLRMEGTLDQLPDFGCATISDCGTWLAVASTNGDIKVFDTYTGESFLWPKADVDLCGCDFRESFVGEHLKGLLKMNGGIVD